jgi:hypothetical protein
MSPENEAELNHTVAVANCAMAIMRAQVNCDALMIAKGVSAMAVCVVGDDARAKTALALFLIDLARELDRHALAARWQ